MTGHTQVSADDKLPLIRVVREFAAPVHRVFRAHTDPEIFRSWIGPHRLETVIDEWDCRPGGAYRFHQSESGHTFSFRGCFHDVRPEDGVIVQTFAFEGFADQVALERLTLQDLGDGRTRLTTTSLAETFEARDAMIASGMEGGISEGYEKLDRLLGKQ